MHNSAPVKIYTVLKNGEYVGAFEGAERAAGVVERITRIANRGRNHITPLIDALEIGEGFEAGFKVRVSRVKPVVIEEPDAK